MPFRNPIGPGLRPGRVDMGVDYTGAGPLYALGAGTITSVANAGWPGGTFIGLHLTDIDRYVYYAENIAPAVTVGQKVQAGQVIGHARGFSPNIEVGWAAPPGTGETMAARSGQARAGVAHGDPGTFPTGYGVSFSNLVRSLGGPAGIIGGPVQGAVPAGWDAGVPAGGGGAPPAGGGGGGGGGGISDTSGPGVQLTSVWSDLNPVSWIRSLWGDLSGPVKAGVSIADSIATIARDFEVLIKAFGKILNAIEWFFVPSHWVRIFAFTFGVAALLPGLYALMKTGSGSYGDITLALGILLVTLSGVLLFIAFHNLPDSVRDLRGLLSWISSSVRQGAPAGAG